jgi:hypothetical protein
MHSFCEHAISPNWNPLNSLNTMQLTERSDTSKSPIIADRGWPEQLILAATISHTGAAKGSWNSGAAATFAAG